jgi:glycosyltransferase involved in cell wall biosynthesis
MAPVADVTVIIPAYRAEQTIGRALASVAGQTLKPRAVVVVDDGSPDGTRDAALAWRDRMEGVRLTVIGQPNAGPGAARNRAIAAAETEFLAFLDADDEWLPEKLARSMAHMADGDYVLVAHDSFAVDGTGKRRIAGARRFRDAEAAPFVGLYRKGFIDTGTVVTRRDAVLAAGGFDTMLANGQDFELWLALLKRPGSRFVVFDEALAHYHLTAGGVMSHVERRRRCCMEIARRYVFDLENHPGWPLTSLWFRTTAVHYEAAIAHLARGAYGAMIGAGARLPGSLLTASLGYLLGRCPPRHPGLA